MNLSFVKVYCVKQTMKKNPTKIVIFYHRHSRELKTNKIILFAHLRVKKIWKGRNKRLCA